MKLLLDAHTLLWWLAGNPKLSAQAAQTIADPDNQAFVSVASLWEMSIKHAAGKLPEYIVLGKDAELTLQQQGFILIPVFYAHAYAAANLPMHHRDPFDRLLLGTSQVEGMTLVSKDEIFKSYPVQLVW